MKLLKVITLSILILASLSFADETGGKFGIGAKGGFSHYFGDIGGSKPGFYYDLNANYWFTDMFGAAFVFGKGFLQAEEGEKYFKTDLWSYSLLLRLKVFPSSPVNPYLTAGYEMIDIDPKGKNDLRLPNIRKGKYDKTQYAVPVGIGLSYYISDNFAIDAEALLHLGMTDYIDDIEAGSSKDNWITAAIGISVSLGGTSDTDNDGIPDDLDADPYAAEDMDGFQDEDGAPDPDNDNDGVPDVIDGAVLLAEDIDGFEDKDGIPDPDNDGDGILDVNDKDMMAAEDVDGFQDEDGAPDPDNDGDGILDGDDQCPDSAETINGFEDEDGCPDKKPEIDVRAGEGMVLEGVNFGSGSSKLTMNSSKILDKVVRTMTEYPGLEVEVRGYTDNTGSYQGNVRLSQRRADSVREYLIIQGIRPSRVKAKGFGPDKPIAPNNTKEGRAKNRRIEFFRVK